MDMNDNNLLQNEWLRTFFGLSFIEIGLASILIALSIITTSYAGFIKDILWALFTIFQAMFLLVGFVMMLYILFAAFAFMGAGVKKYKEG